MAKKEPKLSPETEKFSEFAATLEDMYHPNSKSVNSKPADKKK